MRLLLSGSHGLIGTHAMRVLSSRGHQVTPLVRRNGSERSAKVAWRPAEGFIEAPKLEEIQGVIHLAGAGIADGRWTEARRREIRDSRVQGTRLLAETLAALPRRPKFLFCASAMGFYGHRGDAWLDEEAGPGTGFLAEVCQEWEAAADPARAAGIRVVHLRLGVVLSVMGGALARMLPPFRLGLGGRLGDGSHYLSWIGLPDVSNALAFLIDHPEMSGPINLVAPQPVTNAEFTRALARALRRPALLPVPRVALRLLFGREMADEVFLASARLRPAVLQAAGFRFRFEELRAALDSLLRHRI
jgi:uncharacterized protein (TIGR01777 family)